MEMVGYGLMIVVYAGGMLAFIIPTMFFIDWKISLVALLPMLFMTLCIFLSGENKIRRLMPIEKL